MINGKKKAKKEDIDDNSTRDLKSSYFPSLPRFIPDYTKYCEKGFKMEKITGVCISKSSFNV